MIDFTKCKEELNSYKGSEKKKTLIYNDKKYLVKFPDPVREKNKDISYINNAYSEYIGSNIFKICNFDVQNTILGIYKYKEKQKIVCGCEDFTSSNIILYEFENLALSVNPDKKIGTEINDIIDILKESSNINFAETNQKFWNMFIIDALIGNTDRHNGNWGFLLNNETKEVRFAPIYDCGSCLNPMLEDTKMQELNETDIKNLAINVYSCMMENGKKINYMSYIKERKNEECNKAVMRIFKNIDIDKIHDFIEKIDCLSQTRKNFYKKVIDIRYEIISDAYKELNN